MFVTEISMHYDENETGSIRDGDPDGHAQRLSTRRQLIRRSITELRLRAFSQASEVTDLTAYEGTPQARSKRIRAKTISPDAKPQGAQNPPEVIEHEASSAGKKRANWRRRSNVRSTGWRHAGRRSHWSRP